MKFTFGGDRLLNGKKWDFRTYKLFNGPFIQSERGSGIVRMLSQGQVRELDFNKVTITEWKQ
jgi:hypothetical protein